MWSLVDAVSEVLNAYQALASLPWGPDWILRTTQGRGPGASYRTDRTRQVHVIGAGGSPLVRFQPARADLPLIEVRWSDSREETRQRWTAEAERHFYPIYLTETGRADEPVRDAAALRRDRRFRRWLGRGEAWPGTMAALESTLDRSHPPGTRPHTRAPLRRIRRDVAIWTQVEICRQR